jgi:thiopeptide-type bacteriocin biosynthesis protein
MYGGLRARELADQWFVVRYRDSFPHLRFRLHWNAVASVGEGTANVCRWATGLVDSGIAHRFDLATYRREVERYGGEQGVSAAERIACVDSESLVRLLRLGKHYSIDRAVLAVVSVDELLRSWGLDEQARTSWCGRSSEPERETGIEYRLKGRLPQAALAHQQSCERQLEWLHAIREVLAQRTREIAPFASTICQLERKGELSRPWFEIQRVLMHMHLNRLLGPQRKDEERILGLFRRSRLSLGQRLNQPVPCEVEARQS